ncbi:MAG TPA: DUF2007 domain-containing protein [Chitinophaga sp.]|uniref:putative signal transducing protein n=1 Tax=Chitinophaga sp. TaxID=1869181 RepID=UPI002B61AC0B|nr:DUF2007 domain-containing protein [Chitinophaga sp.]HVI43902.1 DUF2007 domain-containing protein [Chitinophaga sp.]
MEKDWVKIFSTDLVFEAEIVKGMLLEHGINAVLLNRQSSSYTIALPGQAELYVHESEEKTARDLVQLHNNHPEGDTPQAD